ncbi:head GIN domain-containing protein [Gillisia sp. Q332]|uniref:head GIN domain-containing protein n=1 Tax=Gillisia xinjiangensis TaxID=3384765 RepID=UPI00391D7621
MKKTILILAALLLSISTANAQWWKNDRIKGNGEMTTQSRNVPNYEKVTLVGSMDVELISGKEGALKVEAESNLQEYITTEVTNGVLKISVKKGVSISPSGNRRIKVIVPFEEIEGVSITGSGDIRNSDQIKAKSFETRLTGSGNLKLNLNVKDLNSAITGSGNTELKGTAENFSCSITGSGDFEAFNLRAAKAEVTISGSGDVEITATEELKARVSGSGDIKYNGNPKKQDFKTTGSGSISSN